MAPDSVDIGSSSDSWYKTFYLPPKVVAFIYAFDTGKPVKPFTFNLVVELWA